MILVAVYTDRNNDTDGKGWILEEGKPMFLHPHAENVAKQDIVRLNLLSRTINPSPIATNTYTVL